MTDDTKVLQEWALAPHDLIAQTFQMDDTVVLRPIPEDVFICDCYFQWCGPDLRALFDLTHLTKSDGKYCFEQCSFEQDPNLPPPEGYPSSWNRSWIDIDVDRKHWPKEWTEK